MIPESAVLVTGGAGFVGRHLVQHLLQRGERIFVLDSFEPQAEPQEIKHGKLTTVTGSVGDRERLDVLHRVARDSGYDIDRVVHLAALVGIGQSMYEIERYVRGNTLETATFLEDLIERDPRPRRLVVASSMSVYGEGTVYCSFHDGLIHPDLRTGADMKRGVWNVLCPQCNTGTHVSATAETAPLMPTSIYAITKRDQEELCLTVGNAYGIATTALRFFNIYGPGQALANPYTGVAAIFAARILNGRPCRIFEDGCQARDFIHVSDVVRAITAALDSDDAAGEAVNVGTGVATPVNNVAVWVAAGLGRNLIPEPELGGFRAGDIRSCYAATEKALSLLRWEAQVSLQDGMISYCRWLREQDLPVERGNEALAELSSRGLTA